MFVLLFSQEMKETLDVQLGLRLWCQPVVVLPDEVVVAFVAPHDRVLKHQVRGRRLRYHSWQALRCMHAVEGVGLHAH